MPVLATEAASGWILGPRARVRVSGNGFPSFIPKEVERIRDLAARELAKRIERLPVKVSFTNSSIMSSCVKPSQRRGKEPIVLLHGFDSSCLEWRYTLPLLEDAGLETWAVDILGWGFSDLEMLPPSNVAAKREHLFQLWRLYIKRPMVLVGPSLGAAVAIDFAANHPEEVSKLVLIDASVYAEGTGTMTKLPRALAYAGVGRLHCLLPWWEDTTVDFMVSGGYNVSSQIKQIKQKSLIIWGEDDQIISSTNALRLQKELQNSVLHRIPECGHIPHVEKPMSVAESILEFLQGDHS
ncbi:monoacylglycerol lipase ABHD6 isoform X2 [Phoenix dactylifera]|uniref:Monoacylglycerol lipase ABHD6 isoform X2 n=1 Tax=Phoenix dactylifera TaxID=42345 RepID=A0A8B7C412_PHODC|nr:monoacylglycerol lipase ABHD6 isoform X2 [Phoenix dactylifera]